MGERKVLNKYYPPSFDPKNIPRLRTPKNHQKKIRFMLGIRIRCNTCGNYMSEGTKFNSLEEEIIGENYLGLKLHRFYIKCTNCLAEITIRTDPQNSGYIAESGATCVHHKQENEEEKHEEREDALKSLEERTIVSKREIDIMATLDEMKSTKSRRSCICVDSMLKDLSRRRKEGEEEEEKEKEDLIIKSIKFGKRRKIIEYKIHERPKRGDCPKSSIKISSLCVFPKKTAKLPIGIESLCHNYGSD